MRVNNSRTPPTGAIHRRLFPLLALAIWLTPVAVVTQSPAPPTGVRILDGTAPPPPPPTPSDVTVATWNVQISSSAAHAATVISRLVSMSPRPQIIVIQEGYQALFGTYINELQTRTGVTWTGVFKAHCPPGGWSGGTCTRNEEEGVGVFTSLPLLDSGTMYLPFGDSWHSARAAVRAAVSVNGVTLQVFSVHLIPSNITARYSSMTMLKNWAAGYSKPQVMGGDFNADPDQIMSSQGMSPDFINSWATVGSGSGFTYPVPTPTMKLDYLMYDRGGRAQPLSTAVVTSTSSTSDHYPVRTTYRVN
jgi:endonuclease/exonuclease/phosphatase family metal-dependent hydrolase